jgi:hypothetical protein
MSFDVFLQALIKIAEFKYSDSLSASEALQSLIKQFLVPLHERICKQSKMKHGHEGGIIDIKFDELVALIYRDVGGVLLEVYKMYFPNEVKGS